MNKKTIQITTIVIVLATIAFLLIGNIMGQRKESASSSGNGNAGTTMLGDTPVNPTGIKGLE